MEKNHFKFTSVIIMFSGSKINSIDIIYYKIILLYLLIKVFPYFLNYTQTHTHKLQIIKAEK